MIKILKRALILPILLVGFSGCVTKTVKPNNLDIINFEHKKEQLKENEQIVYFIRSDELQGFGLKFFVECNNHRAIISRGEYISCKTSKQLNTVGFGMVNPGIFSTSLLETESTYSSTYFTLDNLDTKEIFFLIKPSSKKMFEQVDNQLGMSYIGSSDYKKTEYTFQKAKVENHTIALLNPSMNYYMEYEYGKKYKPNPIEEQLNLEVEQVLSDVNKKNENKDILAPKKDLSLTSTQAKSIVIDRMSKKEVQEFILSKSLMKLDNLQIRSVPKDKSRIIVFRGPDNGNISYGIWTKKQFIGSLFRETYIEFLTDSPKLRLFTNYARWTTLDLDLEKGKTYYIKSEFSMGWETNYIDLVQVDKEEFNEKEYFKTTIDVENIPINYKKRINEGIEVVNKKY